MTTTTHNASPVAATGRVSVTQQAGHFTGGGGLEIFYRSWHGDTAPRAVLVLVHGFKAHSGYAQWSGEQFAAQGLAVYACVPRGAEIAPAAIGFAARVPHASGATRGLDRAECSALGSA